TRRWDSVRTKLPGTCCLIITITRFLMLTLANGGNWSRLLTMLIREGSRLV
ncbi:unnamed protein product, partial [Brassica oleracea]